MSAVKTRKAPITALAGLDVREYGQLVASRYAARDGFGRVTRPNLVVWTVPPISDSEPVNPAAVAVLMPLTDDELALMAIPTRFTTRIPGERRAIARAAARRGINLGQAGAPQATLDWLGDITAAVLDLSRAR